LLTEWNTSDEVQPRLSEAPGGENGTARAARRTGDGAPHHCPESSSMAGSWSPSPTCCGKAASRPLALRDRQTGGQVIPLGQHVPKFPPWVSPVPPEGLIAPASPLPTPAPLRRPPGLWSQIPSPGPPGQIQSP